ncbi:unnamed protein product [Mytilus coruscus]|uniref:Uncharacterized protein n=1 Tax=Mytilus coruscus TaxID=42192 RepID=A0A6J8EFH0_MYTCO|nr:unnamed protein product [Mytilus coruscus]
MVCPSAEQWYLRAVIKCPSLDQYTCLSDFSDQIYNESCSGPIVALPGERRVNSNKNFDIKPCTFERYQPVTFSSTHGSACLFQKGKCSEEGLLLYNNGTSEMDRTCRCDYTRGFSFMSTHRTDPCSCNAATEDCSCYKKECNESQVLSPDYKCINETQQQSTFLCSFISSIDSVKNITDVVTVNVYEPILPNTQVYRYAATCCTIILVIMIVFYILWVYRWEQTVIKKFEECE